MKISVITLGCKVNYCESASIIATLRKHNYETSEGQEPADVYVLNTCSVTAEADKKSRQHIAKLVKLNPNCRIIVVGCSSQNTPSKFVKSNVIAIGGAKNKSDFVLNVIESIYNNNNYNTLSDIIQQDIACNDIANNNIYCYEEYPEQNRTRAFIKIQDGCNRFCTYCIIPYLRGRSRSRKISDIFNECSLIKAKEIVLTGVDISYYGLDIGESLTGLISALKGVKARKRLGSLECEAINDGLLEAMIKSDCCPHFHLSLQSGSDEVLRSMNRKYNSEYYYEKVKLIRKYFPNAGITTDVIVGFPTESEEMFRIGCEFIEKCEFSDIHVFPYSKREGTLAAKKYGELPHDIVKERVNRLLDIKHRLHDAFLNKHIGLTAPVYIEDSEDGFNVGYTPNYIKVYSHAPRDSITKLKLVKQFKDGMLAEIPTGE